MSTRRAFLQRALALGGGAIATPTLLQGRHDPGRATKAVAEIGDKSRPVLPVLTPDVPDLPFRLANGVKEFHLIAEPVKQELMPGRVLNLWGFNGSAPGPTIQVNQGDSVRIIV